MSNEPIKKFTKVSGYKISIQISIVFLYTPTKKQSTNEIKKIISFTVKLKIIKC